MGQGAERALDQLRRQGVEAENMPEMLVRAKMTMQPEILPGAWGGAPSFCGQKTRVMRLLDREV